MPIEEVGKNGVKITSEGGSLQEIQARIKAAESSGLGALMNPSPPAPQGPAPVPTSDSPAPVTVPPPEKVETKPTEAEIKPEHVQKFKNPDGSLNDDKVIKSNEHLKMGIEEKQAKLLKLNRELTQKFTKVSQELSEKNNEKKNADEELDFSKPSEEVKKKILADLEADPIETILRLSRTGAKQVTEPIIKKVDAMSDRSSEEGKLKELDSLVDKGHGWILEEGTSRFESVFAERPYLLQSKTPYADALLFMNIPASGTDIPKVTHLGQKTPIIGASQTVPPPSSAPPLTTENQLEVISNQIKRAIADRDFDRAKELSAQQDRLYKGMF